MRNLHWTGFKHQADSMKKTSIPKLFRNRHSSEESLSQIIHDYLDAVALTEDNEIQKKLLNELIQSYVRLERKVDQLLKNTLPEAAAEEIKLKHRFSCF